MGLVQYAQDLYSLETLDTRFVGSSKHRFPDRGKNLENELSESQRRDNGSVKYPKPSGMSEHASQSATSPRWTSPEFYLYYVIFIVAVPLMFKSVYEISSCE